MIWIKHRDTSTEPAEVSPGCVFTASVWGQEELLWKSMPILLYLWAGQGLGFILLCSHKLHSTAEFQPFTCTVQNPVFLGCNNSSKYLWISTPLSWMLPQCHCKDYHCSSFCYCWNTEDAHMIISSGSQCYYWDHDLSTRNSRIDPGSAGLDDLRGIFQP